QAGATVRLSPLEIRLRGGQRILFRGADDPGKSKSTKLAKGYFSYLWFEELSEFRGMEDIRQIQASIIRGGGPAVTVCTYNPPASMASWVNEEALSPDPNRLVHSSTYLDLPAQWLGEGFIAAADALKARDQAAYRHMYLGEATGLGTNVFRRLSLRSVTDAEIDALGEAYCGLDWGWFPDPTHFVRCGWNAAARRLVVYDELRAVRMDNRRLAEALRTRAEGCEIIADSAEPKSIADLRAEGWRCVAAWKGAGSVRAGLKWLQGLNEIVIDPARCPYAAREFSRYEYERDREGNPVDAYPDRDNHSIDAVRYAMNRVWMRAGA
ncbi:MAG: phage terminase large subunit, partial [Clostridia bacterium]|nr:phage terminase large subunit [Clostridia bacterium]